MSTSEPTTASRWESTVATFATSIGKDLVEVTSALAGLVGEPTDAALELLADESLTPFDEIKGALTGVPTAKLRKAVADHLRKKAAPAAASALSGALNPTLDVLPSVMDDGAWLTALKAGGELKVDTATVISAVRAALAHRAGLYDVPGLLVDRMEGFADELSEPVGAEFFRLRNMLTKRSYAEIFAALGIEGQFMTEKRRRQLLERLETILWPQLLGFNAQLGGWMDSWQKGASNPALLMSALAAAVGGGGAMPAAMMAPPPTDVLRDGAEAVIEKVNKVFAGVGIPVARALAYDAQRIKEVLENPTLAVQIGAANREQMLRMLGVTVAPDYVRLEQNLTRFALGVMEIPRLTAGQGELVYLTSLFMLGSQIPWDRLQAPAGGARVRTRGAGREALVVDRDDER